MGDPRRHGASVSSDRNRERTRTRPRQGGPARNSAGNRPEQTDAQTVMYIIVKLFDSVRRRLAIVLLAADATGRFDGGSGRRKRQIDGREPAEALNSG